MKKKLLSIAAVLLALSVPTAANASVPTQVFMNGNKLNSEVSSQNVNGTTFVPLRTIAEALGFQVTWENEQHKVTLDKADKRIQLTIGNPVVQVNDSLYTLDSAPYIESGSSMLPVRFLAQQFGLQIDWDQATSSVFVNDRANSSLTPPIDHIVVVVEENHSYNQIVGSPDAPYMQSLIQRGALFTNAHGVTHPSQPNYLALFSGSTQGVTDDICKKPFTSQNLVTELLSANLTFTGYSEDLPTAGYTGCWSNGYARKHNPWVQFTNVPKELNQPYSQFPQDFTNLPNVSFVIPNHQDDMHDGSVKQADDWLQTNLDAYVTWAQTHRSLLIVTWDEDDYAKANHIPLIVVGPMVKPGQYDEYVNHKNVLRTIEDVYRLPLLRDVQQIQPITSMWK
ncbi:stalk domain-containing protein [Paenibacillus alginolyticus]|uniref:Stalk domain-containing protein n=1 Tax=Paenibacillus alginolyticus TaxID=59839 RepID=A0ABT4GLK1_9BACL|nr:alkaline phosphatase family protein [Paenibacillus alginolyticus]MCY9667293.1 stalk domain-containing protein [Paenibacillus alginolyticus]MCY9696903.1 stalk domain-containing protein [Paenibacillus alginolyticus]MEC0142016.1 alkaline phosphatase family protein [Paenibacillus alginolyticus]